MSLKNIEKFHFWSIFANFSNIYEVKITFFKKLVEQASSGDLFKRACIDNRFWFREIFNSVDDRRIAVNKKKLSNFSAMKNRVAS
jgi:hypothetical protein